MKLLALEGIKSYYAVQAVHKLLYGVKMLPTYQYISYENFLSSLDLMSNEDQENLIREAITFVRLEKEEILDICSFCADKNGIPYGMAQLSTAKPEFIHEVIVLVAMEIMRAHKVKLVTDTEKKKSEIAL